MNHYALRKRNIAYDCIRIGRMAALRKSYYKVRHSSNFYAGNIWNKRFFSFAFFMPLAFFSLNYMSRGTMFRIVQFLFSRSFVKKIRVICNKPGMNLLSGLRSFCILQLIFCRMSLWICKNFNNLSVLKLLGKRNDFSVCFCANNLFANG